MKVSVIVPIYNVDKYLAACLDSIYVNTCDLDAEVLLIDDGSTDGSAAIARSFANEHRGFKYVWKENGGVGQARNLGVSMSDSEYIYFIDSDDIITPNTISTMLKTASSTGSELVVCDVRRMSDDGKMSPSPIHIDSFSTLTSNLTHIKRHTKLVNDTTSWNKLLKRDLFERAGVLFPERCYFQDIPVTFPWHYCANSTSVVRRTHYLWRLRSGGEASATQRTLEPTNLATRIAMLNLLLEYVGENVREPEIRRELECKFIKVDLAKYVYKLPLFESDSAREAIETIASFVEHNISDEALSLSSLRNQQVYKDVLSRDLDHLERVLNYSSSSYSRAPISKGKTGPIVSLPEDLFTITTRDQSNDLRNSLPQTLVTSISLDGNQLNMRGHLHYSRIDIPRVGDQLVSACLLNDITGTGIQLDCRPCESPELTREKGIVISPDDYRTTHYSYDGCGFSLGISLSTIDSTDGLEGSNTIIISHSNWAISGARILRGANTKARSDAKSTTVEGSRYHGSVSFDPGGTVLLELHDGIRRIAPSVYLADLEPELVSVIIPVTNFSPSLGPCVKSFAQQSHRNLEILLVDSRQTTERDYGYEIESDGRIKVLSSSHEDECHLINQGLDACSGSYVMVANPDTVLTARCVERLLSAMRDEEAQMVSCAFDASTTPTENPYICTDHAEPCSTVRDSLCFLDGWQDRPIWSVLLDSCAIGDARLDPDYRSAAGNIFLAQVGMSATRSAHLDERLIRRTIPKEDACGVQVDRITDEVRAWGRVAELLADGPRPARDSAKALESALAITALKNLTSSGALDKKTERELLRHVRRGQSSIPTLRVGEHDKRMLMLFARLPRTYLALYALKNRRR